VSIDSSLLVTKFDTIADALVRLDKAGKGILLLLDTEGRLQRTVTDGDLRRLLISGCALDGTLEQLAEKTPITVYGFSFSYKEILAQMNEHGVNHVVVVDDHHKPMDILYRQEIDTSILLSTPHLGEEEKVFVAQAFNTNWIAPVGPNIDAFEQELAEKVGVKHAVAVSSGTAAIHLALRALNVEAGDVVFCSDFTFVASISL